MHLPGSSEHRIVVLRLLGDVLDDGPMFDDLAVLDAEDVDGSLAAVRSVERDVVVDEDEIYVRADVLELCLALREFLEPPRCRW